MGAFWTFLRDQFGENDSDDSSDRGATSSSPENPAVSTEFLEYVVPRNLEKFLWFGFTICLDSFLFFFTVLPIRIVLAIFRGFRVGFRRTLANPTLRADIVRACVFVVVLGSMFLLDLSSIYHSIRGQSFMKFYFLYNTIELLEKLVASFEQDLLDAVFQAAALPPRFSRHRTPGPSPSPSASPSGPLSAVPSSPPGDPAPPSPEAFSPQPDRANPISAQAAVAECQAECPGGSSPTGAPEDATVERRLSPQPDDACGDPVSSPPPPPASPLADPQPPQSAGGADMPPSTQLPQTDWAPEASPSPPPPSGSPGGGGELRAGSGEGVEDGSCGRHQRSASVLSGLLQPRHLLQQRLYREYCDSLPPSGQPSTPPAPGREDPASATPRTGPPLVRTAIMALVYSALHATLLLYQLCTLHVAFNSSSSVVFSLILSNQLVQVRQALFRRFAPETLFQIACSDVVERFTLLLYLLLIGINSFTDEHDSSALFPLLDRVFTYALVFALTECAVDWVKHVAVVKHNNTEPNVYKRFGDILGRDLLFPKGGRPTPPFDRTNEVARRVGFLPIPLACMAIRVLFHTVDAFSWATWGPWAVLGLVGLCLVALKVLMSILFMAYTCIRFGLHGPVPGASPPTWAYGRQPMIDPRPL
ncbi:putative Endoplasmic reticulum membrane protein 65 [Paratrimastix pyriformis]|uniref:Endoplasmic reticulum membrane protein 65 n=1 Tax=Paratrimastix pyriformis TaxID=342808 RepID=A0ABQ8UUQ8_9EUKA|nr:putative Endoplasmic reticulum membrane protein 65 [Paratrimastix pyriformis]